MSTERRQAILTILNVRDSIRVGELSERLGVSEVTIRKDLAFLEDQGFLARTHGGAVPAERNDPRLSVLARAQTNAEAKTAIAAAARELIQHGETIFIDSGTTTAALADLVTEMELRVVTNNVQVLNRLVDRPGIALFMIGGSYRHDSGSFIGPWAEENLRRIHLDHAFMGATGVGWEGTFSARNSIEANTKRAAIAAARSTVVLADRTKLGVQAFSIFADAREVSVLVTDADRETCAPLEELGIHIVSIRKNGRVRYEQRDGQ
ncbi:MAG: DeoR/GlpR transcriptional regulator [Spirochaetaceae bacterium]|nr:MAG: DeoR/GlpR transcriptional regulator [Spirochaetaceae bacterium]